MTDLEARLWAWAAPLVGRQYELRVWDCFQLGLEGQEVAGFGRAFEPTYRDGKQTDRSAALAMVRNFSRGFRQFKRLDAPLLGALALFRDEGVPFHVGLYMGANRMLHVNVSTATTIAEIGPGTDYNYSLDGFYVPA